MTRYYPRDEPADEVYGAPDYAQHGWEYAALSDLDPSPIGVVAVCGTREAGREQVNVTFFGDYETPARTDLRVRARHWKAHWRHEGDEEPELTREEADLDNVEYLQISSYGPWGAHGLIAALREAADMLEAGLPRT